jgi:ABC-type nitrate/sulfonate/bicarbonate transport system substrate-binding protein
MTSLRRSYFVRALSVAGAAASAPFLAGAAPLLGKPEKPRLRVGLPVDATVFLPVYIAAAKTWAAQGLDVELVAFNGDAPASQALVSGSTDFNVSSPNALINAITAGQPIVAFYAGFWQSDFEWLAAPSIKRWSDLKGKSLGVTTFGSLTEALTRYVLIKNEIDPDRDVQLQQTGGSASSYQALKAGRIAATILATPYKWQAAEDGFVVLATQIKDVAPQWPKQIFVAKTDFLNSSPNTIAAVLRAHVAALRLARAQREYAVGVLSDRLKYEKRWAERAYDDMMGGFNERGGFPDKYMPVFWKITMVTGDVKAAWPNSKLLDDRWVRSFNQWAPTT